MFIAKSAQPTRLLASVFLITALFIALTVPSVRATEVQEVTSPGGIKAWLVEEHGVPLLSMRFAFKGSGSSQDPEGKEGLANLMSGLLDEGAGELTSQAFQEKLEDLSITIKFNAGRDSFGGTLNTLTMNRDEAFDLLALAVNDPRFDDEPVERIRTQIITSIKRSERDPNTVAGRAFSRILFAGHPYERPNNGTKESLETITTEDLIDFHRRAIARDNLRIGVVGDITAEELGAYLDQVFLPLPEKADLLALQEVEAPLGLTESIDLDVPQTVIRFALPGLKRHDPDFFPAFVMAHILGGGSFSSWLYEEVREKRGLAYGISADLSLYQHTGLIAGGTATRTENTDKAIEIIKQQLNRMATEGPTQEELEAAQKFLTGSYALRFDTSGKIAGQLLGIQLNDLGSDYFVTRNDKVRSVTLEDVKRVAKRLLSDKEPSIVTVGRVNS